ncbi:helix-turn-helix domain-containing protein [Komagataeibacter nataicola]|uniref:helix-turn-helix domain-containing protein n=1 Tax=Komagataeibacter nataicola TaxID=265960 RepID=UPI00125DD24C|nr:LysR family transcriptional regulator [Komagataeibacter nataicola]
MDTALPDLRQLEAFCAVMATGSMTGGARLVGRSQSMVTRMNAGLEAGLGFTLFHRNGPRITPPSRPCVSSPSAGASGRRAAPARETCTPLPMMWKIPCIYAPSRAGGGPAAARAGASAQAPSA